MGSSQVLKEVFTTRGTRVMSRFHGLISAFHEITGVPLVVNTSFNTYDEPMVCSPADALKTFLRTDLDCLVMDRFLVERPSR